MDEDPIVVFMTAANGEEATRLADMLVGAHLAACVQILPEMESVYRWQGKVERQAEVLLIAKRRGESLTSSRGKCGRCIRMTRPRLLLFRSWPAPRLI